MHVSNLSFVHRYEYFAVSHEWTCCFFKAVAVQYTRLNSIIGTIFLTTEQVSIIRE